MNIEHFSPRTQQLMALLGPVLIVLAMVGFCLSGLFPPSDPEASARQIQDFYRADTQMIRVGVVLMCIAFALFAPWGAAIAMWCRKIEGSFPVMAYGQLACVGGSTAIVMVMQSFWAVAAYRPTTTSAETTQMLHDVAWFLFLFTWPPFSLWCLLVGAAVLKDRAQVPIFPRWVGYLSVWTALILAPAMLMTFFKDGPMAYDGVIAFYIPLSAFFSWMMGMTYAMLRHIGRLARQKHLEPDRVAMASSVDA